MVRGEWLGLRFRTRAIHLPCELPRHALEDSVDSNNDQTFPTEQMTKYKKQLKETGRKPVRKKREPPEQHFDDCGEDMASIMHVSLVPESYFDTYSKDHEPHCLYMDIGYVDTDVCSDVWMSEGDEESLKHVDSFFRITTHC